MTAITVNCVQNAQAGAARDGKAPAVTSMRQRGAKRPELLVRHKIDHASRMGFLASGPAIMTALNTAEGTGKNHARWT
ncbi:hypothetical protein SBA1_220006 [Candidatus Sulfotelmatobacter kueseliae]|uniref:Uncharacterized protein n=1 Tax=Candidatus Sulfotelmatobacter kueseliae TaxID=2042962 RepID=A0A2U3KGX1_9BACT|nr:hypothetical protein SBA1_220006 [Candidatus Sulfotelmatobacter kueseliae]